MVTGTLGLGLLAGLLGLGFYYFGFGQTFVGSVTVSASAEDPAVIGKVQFQSRFKNTRFLTHSVVLDLAPDTPCTFLGDEIDAAEVIRMFGDREVEARTGYREHKAGWGRVVSLDLKPEGSSPKETLLILSLLLIFGCTGGMAVVAKRG